MTKVYSVKELAKIIEPGCLGMKGTDEMLVFRPIDEGDPRVKLLADETNWSRIPKDENATLMAAPTLENYYDLIWAGVSFAPTKKVNNWLRKLQVPYLENLRDEVPDEIPLFDFQLEAATFLYFHNRAMLSLSPGLGKTLTAAYAAGMKNFTNILVVCPASLLFYWKGELEKWANKLPLNPLIDVWHRQVDWDGVERLKHPVDSLDQFEEVELEGEKRWVASGAHWYITNPETVVKHLEQLTIQLSSFVECLIVDESIMYKHRDSQRSQAVKELAQHIRTCWLLTGAPATRFLDDMWHQFHILKPKGYPSEWRFRRKYCIISDDEWGSKVVANQPDAEEKIKKNFADIYFSRTQDDVVDIPDWIMEDIDIPMLPKQDKAYETLRKHLFVQLSEVDPTQVITVDNHLSLMIRSVQVASNPLLIGGVDEGGKWDALPELMELYPGPHLVWVNFIKTGELLRDHFGKIGKRVALANGSTSMKDRNEMVDAMQKGELDVFILNNQVGKFGFTLTAARTAFFVERMYDDSYFQCLHRNRRIGTTQSPIIVNMRSVTQTGRKTIDHLIHSTLDYRVGMIKKVTAQDLLNIFA